MTFPGMDALRAEMAQLGEAIERKVEARLLKRFIVASLMRLSMLEPGRWLDLIKEFRDK